jgi:hypothetical protein
MSYFHVHGLGFLLVGILGCNENFSVVLYLSMFLNYCHLYEGIVLYFSFFLTFLSKRGRGFKLITPYLCIIRHDLN